MAWAQGSLAPAVSPNPSRGYRLLTIRRSRVVSMRSLDFRLDASRRRTAGRDASGIYRMLADVSIRTQARSASPVGGEIAKWLVRDVQDDDLAQLFAERTATALPQLGPDGRPRGSGGVSGDESTVGAVAAPLTMTC